MAETQKRFILARASAWNAEGFDKSLYNDSIVFIHNGETNAAPGQCVAVYTKGVEYPVGKALSGETITKAFVGNGTVTYTTAGTKLDGTSANITALSFKQGDNIEITVDEAGALVIKGKDWSEEIANAVAGVDTDFVKEVKESTKNGSILVDGVDVPVHGLASAAYETKESFEDYADDAANAVKNTLLGDATPQGDTLGKLEDRLESIESKDIENAVTDVTVNGTTIIEDKVAKIVVDGDYNKTSNRIATVSTVTGAVVEAKNELVGDAESFTTLGALEDAINEINNKDIVNAINGVSINGTQIVVDENKIANIVTNTAYNAESNKLATMSDVTTAVAGLSGAMHFIGTSTTDPKTEGATVEGVSTFNAGDVVLFGNSEYVYNGTSWIELGTEGDYAVKGSIKNADIAADAAIEQSKIANLAESLAAAKTKVEEKSTGFVKVAKTTGSNGEDVYTVTESDIASAEALANLTAEVTENEEVTAQALVDINGRLDGIDTTIAGLDLGVTSVKASTSSNHVTVAPTTDTKGVVTLTVDIASVNATDTTTYAATGLATDAYVNEKIASVNSAMNEAWEWGEI